MNYFSNLLIIKTNCVGGDEMKRIKISPTTLSFHDCTVLFKDLLCFKIGNQYNSFC
jgi:hypothetical protein